MNNLHEKKSFKFVVVGLIVFGIASMLVVSTVMTNARQQLHMIMKDKAQSIAQILIEQLKAPVDFDDTNAIQEIAASISADVDFGYIYIYTKDGRILSFHKNSSLKIVPAKKTKIDKQIFFVESGMANIATPIVVRHNRTTLMQVGITYERIQNSIGTGMIFTFVAGALSCSFFILAIAAIIIFRRHSKMKNSPSSTE